MEISEIEKSKIKDSNNESNRDSILTQNHQDQLHQISINLDVIFLIEFLKLN